MADGIYCKMNANDPSFIHFPHIRTGDREGIFDTDFSIKKEDDCWHLSFEHVQDDSYYLYFHPRISFGRKGFYKSTQSFRFCFEGKKALQIRTSR